MLLPDVLQEPVAKKPLKGQNVYRPSQFLTGNVHKSQWVCLEFAGNSALVIVTVLQVKFAVLMVVGIRVCKNL